jgi:hypothetical protein
MDRTDERGASASDHAQTNASFPLRERCSLDHA